VKPQRPPLVVAIGGPNGAGKSTIAPRLLSEMLGISEFVNADTIAAGLSARDPARAAVLAGRQMLLRMRELAVARADFAFETTLASRHFAPWLKRLQAEGYRFILVFLWLPSADEAVARVELRVRSGGHGVPEETVRRRYMRGLTNFFGLYRPLADRWHFIDNSDLAAGMRPIASGGREHDEVTLDAPRWKAICQAHAPHRGD
jgi:predicted ABC-type ATPase